MKQKKSNFRLTKDTMPKVWFYIGMVVVAVFAVLFIQNAWIRNMEIAYTRAVNFTESAAVGISGDGIALLQSENKEDAQQGYIEIRNELIQLKAIVNDIVSAYVLIQKDGGYFYAAHSDPDIAGQYVPPGQAFDFSNESELRTLSEGNTVLTRSLGSGSGTYFRVLVPLMDARTDEVVGVYGIDYPLAMWQHSTISNTWNAVLLFAFIFVVCIFFYRSFIKNRQLRAEKNALKKLNNINDRSQAIVHMGNWEIVTGTGRLWASKESLRIYGMEEIAVDSFLNIETVESVVDEGDRFMMAVAMKATLETGCIYDVYYSIRRYNDGQIRKLHSNAILEEEDGVRKIIGVVADVTEKKKDEEKIKENEMLFRTLFEQSPVGMNFGNKKGDILDVNTAFAAMLGRERDDLLHCNFLELTHPDDIEMDWAEFEHMIAGETSGYSLTKRFVKPDGTPVWASITVAPLFIPNKPEMNHICISQDITQRIHAEGALMRSERSNLLLLSNLHGMVYRCAYDRDWTMFFVSEGCVELTGYKPESLIDNNLLSFNDIMSPQYREPIRQKWGEAIDSRGVFRGEYPILTAAGEMKWVFEQGEGVYDDKGQVEALEGLIIDITDRKQREDEILFLHYHDLLTGLFNREAFTSEKTKMDRDANLPIAVVNGDINGLKFINGVLGYTEGDRMIAEIAAIIKSCAGVDDVVARMGGGEFRILLPRTDAHAATSFLQNIQTEFDTARRKPTYMSKYLSFSFGFAIKSDSKEDLDDVIKHAEEHMYRHKLLEQKSSHSAVISSIKSTMLERSQDTEEHAERLLLMARQMGEIMNLSQMEQDELELLATLHDIGKVGIDDNVLNKPGKLTDEEWVQMKKHPEIGYRIAKASLQLVGISEYILTHHERWDGNGYPLGLKEESIPLLSRMIAVVDAFDAMTQDRPYRKSMPKEDALMEIERNAGTQFDPHITEIFVKMVADLEI